MSTAATDTPIRNVTNDQTTSAPKASIGRCWLVRWRRAWLPLCS